MAVVCASSICPPIRAEAYVAYRLNDQFTEQQPSLSIRFLDYDWSLNEAGRE